MRFRILALFFILCLPAKGVSLRFGSLTSREGLSQSEVLCIAEDNRGFIWLGTYHGLNRYDGYNVVTYTIDKNTGGRLLSNTVRAIAEDAYGRLWVGTEGGINVMDPVTQQFHSVAFPAGSKAVSVSSFLVDGNLLWIGTNDGLYGCEVASKDPAAVAVTIRRIPFPEMDERPLQRLRSLVKSPDGTIWAGFTSRAVRFRCGRSLEQVEAMALPPELAGHPSIALSIDGGGKVWSGGSDGLMSYDPRSGAIDRYGKGEGEGELPSGAVSSMIVDGDGNLWVGTKDAGVCMAKAADLQGGKVVFKRYQSSVLDPYGINSNLVFSLFVSSGGILWVGTVGSGVNYADLKGSPFDLLTIPAARNDHSASPNFIRALWADPLGRLWAGTHYNGMFRFDPQRKECAKVGLDRETVYHIAPLRGDCALVCSSSGLSVWRKNQMVAQAPQITATCFHADKSSETIWWVATMAGLYRVEIDLGGGVPVFRSVRLQTRAYSRVVACQKQRRRVWVGCEGGGLNKVTLDEREMAEGIVVFMPSSDPNSLSYPYVTSIWAQEADEIWIGTHNGLDKMEILEGDSVRFTRFGEKEGLPNSMIQSLLGDSLGNLWIGTNAGLTRMNLSTLECRTFVASDGLQGNEFSEHACCTGPDGKLYFGGLSGITGFCPDRIGGVGDCLKVVLTGFYLSGRRVGPGEQDPGVLAAPIWLTDGMKLKPGQNNVRFEFSAMPFASPQKPLYAYRLEGYDKEWTYTGADNRIASYTNLPSGDYIFSVKASWDGAEWCGEVTSVGIYIATPLLLRWYALLVYAALFVFLIWYFTRHSIIKNTTRNEMVLEKEHNRRLHELDNLRTRFFINISHDLRTPLTLIIGPLEQFFRAYAQDPGLLKKLEPVYKSAVRLRYLVEQLLDFRRVELSQEKLHLNRVNAGGWLRGEVSHFDVMILDKGLELRFDMPDRDTEVMMDCRKMSKVVFNLMSNAIKFTDRGFIRAALVVEDEMLRFSIQDSGRGIPPEKIGRIFDRFFSDSSGEGYGIGLSHCRDLVEAQGGTLTVESVVGQGSVFTVSIPRIDPAGDEQGLPLESGMEMAMAESYVPAPPPGVLDPALKTVLVVDDNARMREYVRSCLQHNYNVVEAADGQQGVDMAESRNIDFIISDVMMPVMDGLEFCKRIKEKIETSHIPVILLTAKTDPQTQYAGLESGADDYVAKPFDMELLLRKIDTILSNRRRMVESLGAGAILTPSRVMVTPLDKKFLTSLMAAIEQRMDDPALTVEQIEKQMGMSHSNFFRKLKSLTGLSGKELLQEVRLKRAAQLLEQSDLTVSEIAYQTGFSDPKYFSHCFKQKYHVSPSVYRERK